MPNIGSRKHAKAILDWWLEITAYHETLPMPRDSYSRRDNSRNNPPEGWSVLGSGCFRWVYLHEETNVVYKLESRRSEEEGLSSDFEVKNAQTLYRRSAGDGIITAHLRIPRTSGYRFNGEIVVAMEHVVGRRPYSSWDLGPEQPQGRRDLWVIGKFKDMHGHNIIYDSDGYVVPIDMACRRTRSRYASDLRILDGLPLAAEAEDMACALGY